MGDCSFTMWVLNIHQLHTGRLQYPPGLVCFEYPPALHNAFWISTSFTQCVLNIHQLYTERFEHPPKWLQHCLVVDMASAMWNCCCLGALSVYTVQPCISLQCHFIQSQICRVYVCLVWTCHMQFWQNDWGLLLAMGVTQQWNGLLTVDLREEKSHTASARTQTPSLVLCNWAIATPHSQWG